MSAIIDLSDWSRRLSRAVPVWVVYAAGALPAAALVAGLFTGALGPDAAKALERELGQWALRFLVGGLAITPLLTFLRFNLVKYRRAVGLLAFWYALAHLATYIVLDLQFDWPAIWADIVKRPYITMGMTAFAILLGLALTSNAASIKRLGSEGWKRLHRLVYPAAVLAGLHYLLLVKAWPVEPFVYLGFIALLLGLRLPAIKPRGTVRLARAAKSP